MELQENYAAFEALDTEIISIAQLERDPGMLPRITEFVHNTFPIVADPKQVTRKPFDIFGVYLIDKEGTLRTFIPGTKEARPRLDMILTEIAKIQGVDPPSFSDTDGHIAVSTADKAPASNLPADKIVTVRWMWQYNKMRQGDRFKLAFVTDIAEGYHVYASDEKRMMPFRIDFEFPDGLTIDGDLEYPKSLVISDPILKVDLMAYEDAIPMPVIWLRAAEDMKPGDRIVRATLHYQACNESVCLLPTTKTIEMPLPIVSKKTAHFGVAGSEAW